MTASMESVRELAILRPGARVLSVYVRTDPRDPANTAATPRWLVELRNGLRAVADEFPHRESREHRLALRGLSERVEREVPALDPGERARGLAWFLTSDGTLDRRFTLQLPPRTTLLRWDDRPYVSPLVDVVDRGRPTGLVLVGAEAVRLLHWQAGLVTEPEQSLYELELGDWRDYDAYVGHPGRSPAGMHVATFDQRVEDWRQRFLAEAASRTARKVTELGWHRIVVAGDQRVTELFTARLPESVRDRIVAVVAANLLWQQPAAVAERLEDALHDAWRREVHALVDDAIRAASAGGAAALGWPDVLASLVQHRVQHLAFAADAAPDPDLLTPEIQEALGRPSARLLVERAVEHAVTSGADITAVPENLPSLLPAGGVVATLRY